MKSVSVDRFLDRSLHRWTAGLEGVAGDAGADKAPNSLAATGLRQHVAKTSSVLRDLK